MPLALSPATRRSIRIRARLLALGVALFLVISHDAQATAQVPASPEDAFHRAGIVFLAQVQSIDTDTTTHLSQARLHILYAWKGAPFLTPRTFITDTGDSTHLTPFTLGDRYLFYLPMEYEPGHLKANLVRHRIVRLDQATADLAFLSQIPATPISSDSPREPVHTTLTASISCAPWDGPALRLIVLVAQAGSDPYTIQVMIWGRGYMSLYQGPYMIEIDNFSHPDGTGMARLCTASHDVCHPDPLRTQLRFTQLNLTPNQPISGELTFRLGPNSISQHRITFSGKLSAHQDICG